MFESALVPLNGHRQAMCLECGAIRWAKAQYLGRGSRTLRCVGCQRATPHAAVNWDGPDPREQANSRRSQVNAEAHRELAGLLELYRCCSIDVVLGNTDPATPEGEPQGGLVDVIRWLEPEGYQVRLRGNLSLVDRVYCLDWAWKSLRPAIAEWDRCLVEFDLDGQAFQRIYNNELERGVHELS